MTVSVVVPTVGRATLWRAIASVVDQLEDGDELVVVGDGRFPSAAGIVGDFLPALLTFFEVCEPASVFGNAQRDAGMRAAVGEWLLFLDDDDVYVHGALDVVRRGLEINSHAAHIFRAWWGRGHHAHGVTLWSERVVREQNVATPMVVLPNRPYAVSWMDGNGRGVVSDFAFLAAAVGECGGVEWHSDVIATVRP